MAKNDPSKREPTELDKMVASLHRKRGFEYTARYVEMFGVDAWCPSFIRGANKETESFYKKCVEEGHPYDWYFEFPDQVIF